jgi:imidazolonepropionase-like amidohydrolase
MASTNFDSEAIPMIKKPRIRTFVPVLLLLMASVVCAAQNIVIMHASVYSDPEAPVLRDATVVIRNGVIARVGANLQVPKGVQTISCEGCVVLAGFWNAHVHFMEPKWNDAAHQPAEKLARQMAEMLNHSGFTTVLDTGSDVENTVALRKRVESGEVPGPRIFTAGLPLFPAHALPYYLADLPPDFKAKLGQPETTADAAADVRKNRVAGADVVKLFTGSIVGPNRITPMRVDIAHAAVVEGHQHGQLVFSHSSNLEGTKVAINAGVDVLAHTPEATEGIDEPMLRQMVAQHMTIITTLKLFSRDDDIANIRALDARFLQLGGRLIYGTDTGFLTDYDQGEEFRQLTQAGFGFRDILAMLTTAPTALFHLSKHEGKVLPGMRGDLTILSEDPQPGEPASFTKIRYTIRAGIVIWEANQTRQ